MWTQRVYHSIHARHSCTFAFIAIFSSFCVDISTSLQPQGMVRKQVHTKCIVTKAQLSTIEVLVAMPMTQWEFRIVP